MPYAHLTIEHLTQPDAGWLRGWVHDAPPGAPSDAGDHSCQGLGEVAPHLLVVVAHEAQDGEMGLRGGPYLLALAAALILGGKLGDRFGRRTFFLVGLVGFTLSSVAIGLIGDTDGVIAFRALQGLFGALMLPNTLGLIRAVFPPHRFGMAVGIWAAVNSVATAAGPILGGCSSSTSAGSRSS